MPAEASERDGKRALWVSEAVYAGRYQERADSWLFGALRGKHGMFKAVIFWGIGKWRKSGTMGNSWD